MLQATAKTVAAAAAAAADVEIEIDCCLASARVAYTEIRLCFGGLRTALVKCSISHVAAPPVAVNANNSVRRSVERKRMVISGRNSPVY